MVVTYVNQHLERLLEVRCCCEPVKLYGYLPYPLREAPAAGHRVMFPLEPMHRAARAAPLERLVLPVEWMHSRLPVPAPASTPASPQFLLEAETHLAYKSEDTAIEVIRRVPGFLEAPARMLRVTLNGELIAICFARRSLEVWEQQIATLSERLGVYICVGCGAVSHHPDDLAARYCGYCHLFLDEAS